jgi:imidazoleglycerol-phosphate dehydratase
MNEPRKTKSAVPRQKGETMNEPRKAKIERKTRETNITLELNLDGKGLTEIKTPFGFFDHMITAMAKHALFDLKLRAVGDVHIDAHHTVEDVGIAFGLALAEALGDKRGIGRFGSAVTPMDEAVARAVVDLSGRPFLVYKVEIPERNQWEFDVNLLKEFFAALSANARITLHLKLEYGENYHHCSEAVMKAAGRALRSACEHDLRVKDVPSTKGSLA